MAEALMREKIARYICFASTAIGVLMMMAALARGTPPEHTDPALAPWFRSLQQPNTGVSCCSIADCRAVEYRINGDHYEAFVDEKWRAVPPEKILQHIDNPVGRAVVCYTPALGILCFVRPTET